jgi:transposase
VKLITPRFVKAYLKSNKNDFNDAAAITEAVQRPTRSTCRPCAAFATN